MRTISAVNVVETHFPKPTIKPDGNPIRQCSEQEDPEGWKIRETYWQMRTQFQNALEFALTVQAAVLRPLSAYQMGILRRIVEGWTLQVGESRLELPVLYSEGDVTKWEEIPNSTFDALESRGLIYPEHGGHCAEYLLTEAARALVSHGTDVWKLSTHKPEGKA